MELIKVVDKQADISLSYDDLVIVNNIFNEVCNGLDVFEFETKIGTPLRDFKEYIGDSVLYPQRAYSLKLFPLDAKKIFSLIYNSGKDYGKAFYRYLGKKKDPYDFYLHIPDKCMDPYIFYKIDNNVYTKIIYGKYCPNSIRSKDHVIHSMMFLREQVDTVLKDTYTELQRIYDLLKAQETE